ncbi:MAG: alpha-amylase [Lachnospiraceae bacterium]|nr:alpha-amylase [Lachnospiraceae bacterium]
MTNGIMMQYFEWYLPEDKQHWKRVAAKAKDLAKAGVTSLWLPPAYKGQAGVHDVGYGVYDVYDLGEFDQKGTVETKYGSRQEYLDAIKALQKEGIAVYADIVLNHKMGADGIEEVEAVETAGNNRNQVISAKENIEAWTKFTFSGRNGKYSDFQWKYTHFDGVDWDQRKQKSSIYNFIGTPWDGEVDGENANYDYLMGADVCFSNQEVLDEMDRWGQWYLDTTGVDGFRIDAVKHIKFDFFKNWLSKLRANNQKELFAVGEYWHQEVSALEHYLDKCDNSMSLFDVPLHFNFFRASHGSGHFDMRTILDDSLVQANPTKAVTFVENHDTQPGQALESAIMDWFDPLAYAVILLRPQGYPCVFYGDYYGIPSQNAPGIKDILDVFLKVRRDLLYGVQHDYFDDFDVVGWTLEGDAEHKDSGVAVLITDGPGGEKNMFVGTGHSGETFYNVTAQQKQEVIIGADGCAEFTVDGGSVSVWIKKV